MGAIKTAISLDKSLFTRVEELANELHLSRSGLVALALEDFVRRRDSKRLTEQFNAVYADNPPTEEEKAVLRAAKRHLCGLLADEPY